MQERVINPSEGLYAATPDYVHAIELTAPERLVFISGTMGLAPDGHAPDSLHEQLDLVWSNIRRILAAAEMTCDNIVRVTSYLRDPAYAEANQNARLAALGARRVPTTAIVVQTLMEDWKIEIEVVAAG